MEEMCPYRMSPITGEYVKLTPKYVPSDHTQYDAMVPEEARGLTNFYCAHPSCIPDPCLNGGTCSETLEDFECHCPVAFVGKRCETSACPSSWPPLVSADGSCYLFRSESASWSNARSRCVGEGAHLVAIETGSELTTIRNFILTQYGLTSVPQVWTGLNNQANVGTYVWDGFGGTLPVSSSLWAPTQPQIGGTEYCISLSPDGLHDYPCSHTCGYICEYKP
ncbi:brevican core protein-like isoform X2 [Diadema setosum]